jgi:AcrR family transcriptional regulator
MNIRARLSPEEAPARILAVAEELFRRVGYGKTAIADIAQELGMSSANVYRYFPSKAAINEAICLRLLEASHVMMREIAARQAPASERVVMMILAMHDYNSRCYTGERRMHDMVEAAMEENWGVIQTHMAYVVETFARLIDEGVASGEFKPVRNTQMAAMLLKQSMSCLLHPMMIAERERHGMNTPGAAEALARFAVAALKA